MLHALSAISLAVTAGNAQDLKSGVVDVGGTRLRTVSGGDEGLPTVVFEAGMGEDSSTWKELQTIVSKSTKTFSYDRAGLGKSEPSTSSRNAKQMAIELHMLLEAAKVPGPYILVGHSLGSWIVGGFAHLYPNEVAGIVLIDPAFRESRLQAKLSPDVWIKREKAIAQYAAATNEVQRREKASLEVSGEQAEGFFPIPRVPIVLLSGMRFNPNFPGSKVEHEIKLESHKLWIVRARWTRHVFVEASRHYIHLDQPAEVICSINQIIKNTRKR